MNPATPEAIGIDYRTTKLNVAVVRGRHVIHEEEVRLGRDLGPQIAVIADLVERLRTKAQQPALIIMEAPWARAEAGIQTAIQLHKVPTRVETLAVVAGMTVLYVPVPTWKSKVLGPASKRGKEGALWYCEHIMGVKPQNHDAADAVCLGVWGVQQQRVGAVA